MKLTTVRALINKTKRSRVGTTTLVKLATSLEPEVKPAGVRDMLIYLSRRKVLDHSNGRWYYNRNRYSAALMGFDKEVLQAIPYFPFFSTLNRLKKFLGLEGKEQTREMLLSVQRLYRRRLVDRYTRFGKMKDRNKIISYPVVFRIVRGERISLAKAKSGKKAPTKRVHKKAAEA